VGGSELRSLVRLDFEHHSTDSSVPFRLDDTGAAFANDGDRVVLGGGVLPAPPGQTRSVFTAGSFERVDPPHCCF
jgi:hypothetical protein